MKKKLMALLAAMAVAVSMFAAAGCAGTGSKDNDKNIQENK